MLLEAATRPLVSRIRSCLGVSDALRVAVGLRPRAKRRRRVPAPDAPPLLRVVKTVNRTVYVRLLDRTSMRRGRPRDVDGATILAHVGEIPPADLAEWDFKTLTGRATAEVQFENELPVGTKVWLTAHWFNRRLEPGPWCDPVYAHLPYGSSLNLGIARAAA